MLKFRQLYLKLMYNKMLAGKTGLLHTNVRRYSRDCKGISNQNILHLTDALILFIHRVHLQGACK